ncbi:hypothetical protein AAAC07_26020 [Pseudomonas aeruginosa]
MPLKEWEVLTGDFDWFQVDYLIGDARHYVHRVYAETRSKAKYKVFKDLEEVFDSAEAMLCFRFAEPADFPGKDATLQWG